MIKVSKGWFGRSSYILGMFVLAFLTASTINNIPPRHVLVGTIILIITSGPGFVLWDAYIHREG